MNQEYLHSNELKVVDRVLDDIRREFPVKEAFDYEEKIRQIVNQKIWDVCATLQQVYEEEVLYTSEIQQDQDHKYREAPTADDIARAEL